MKRKLKMRVVIAGGGVGALEAMLALRALAEERVDLTLLSPDDVFTYRPLAVAEPFSRGAVARFSLREIAASCRADYEQGALVLTVPEQDTIHTSRGRTLTYDALIVAAGARTRESVPGAVTFGGPADMRAVEILLEDLEAGLVKRVVFAVPSHVSWTLPLYELALLTATRVAELDLDAAVTLVTPEEDPLAIFGREASASIANLLQEHGVRLRNATYPESFDNGELRVLGGDPIPADWVVTLPRLEGRIIEGIPHDRDGFVQTDEFGRVFGLEDVYAVGDMTTFPIKQGGIAAQQADAVAETIAAQAGADVVPKTFEPVLRGLLLTGGRPAYLRSELVEATSERFALNRDPLWWPAGKIVARYLSPYLAEHARSPSGARYEPSDLLI